MPTEKLKLTRQGIGLLITVLLLAAGACQPPQPPQASAIYIPPSLVLWVWDRADDLRFLRPGEAEVAALMATIYLRDGEAEAWNRRLPLLLPEGLQPTPVVRLESDGSALPPVEKVVELLAHGASWQTLQLDFDARLSQREWYRNLFARLTPPETAHLHDGSGLVVREAALVCGCAG